MNHHRFEFLEVPGTPPPEQPLSGQLIRPESVPIEQMLAYYDLLTLNPAREVLKQLNKKLLLKHKFVPFALLLRHVQVRLPQHFKSEYHSQWVCDSPFTLYIGLCDVAESQCLRLLHNATGYSIYAVPLRPDAHQQFMTEQYDRILNSV